MSGRVVVVGSVNVDLVATVDRLPGPGETVTGATFARHHGGKGGNQATAAARLGARVAFVGAVGDDDLGADARDALAAEAIDLSELTTLPGPTGVALILVDRTGENSIAVAAGANGQVDGNVVEGALGRLAIGADDVVLVGCEIPTDAVVAALRAARAAGATTILNPAPATGLARSVVALADIVIPNRGELAVLAGDVGHDPVAAAGRLLGGDGGPTGTRAVVVTLGAGGAVLVRADQGPLIVEASPVRAVDAVGAGDTFAGALAAALAGGSPLGDAVRDAVAAASLSTTKPGARGGMPTRAALGAFIGRP